MAVTLWLCTTLGGGQAGAVEALLQQLMREDLPPIRRAALLAETPHYPAPQLQQQAILGLQHDDPLVRRSALNAVAEFLPPRSATTDFDLFTGGPGAFDKGNSNRACG